MMLQYEEETGVKMYERLEQHRLDSSKREHKSKGIDDVYSQMTFGDIEHIIITQKQFAKKLKAKIKKVDEQILEAPELERKELEIHKAGYIKKNGGSLKSVWDEFNDDVMYQLGWLRDNFRNPHDHTVEDIDKEFDVLEVVQAKTFSHKLREFIKKVEHNEK